MSILFLSIITTSIFFMCLLISSSSSTNYITSLFLVLFIVKTLNDLNSGSILICSSFINYLSILVWMHSELTSILSYNSFLFDVFIFIYIKSLSLLSLLFKIIYLFFGELLCTEICCTISTSNLQQNPPLCCFFYLYYLNYLVYFYSSYSILTYSFL